MSIYYGEWDKHAAQWLRNLQSAGLIPEGVVDERDVREVGGVHLREHRVVNLFAGIGGWSEALRLAGWPADRPVWTVSCPCPPFSSAGRKKSCPSCGGRHPVPCPRRTGYFICCDCANAWHADDRHLWPEVWRLVRDCRPPVVMGEQVASADGRVWLAGVRGSLEILGYAVRAADLCAPGVGAPHLRQRLFWVAVAKGVGCDEQYRAGGCEGDSRGAGYGVESSDRRGVDGLAVAEGSGGRSDSGAVRGGSAEGVRNPKGEIERWTGVVTGRVVDSGAISGMGDSAGERCGEEGSSGRTNAGSAILPTVSIPTRWLVHPEECRREQRRPESDGSDAGPENPHTHWSDYDLIPCRDGKTRRIESGIQCLVDGLSFKLADGRTRKDASRAACLRGIGNAIVPQLAAVFIRAFLETEGQ